MSVKCILFFLLFQNAIAKDFLQDKGVLPDKTSAIRVAEAYLINVYGETILKQRTFQLKTEGDFWIIDGTLHCPNEMHCKGGTAHLEINKINGQVRKIIHGK